MFSQTPFNVCVREDEGVLSFTRDDMLAYAGLEQLIASGVALRLLSQAFADLSPDEYPERDEIRILTAFPGKGVHDCLELVTRCVTRRRFVLDTSAAPDGAPTTPVGGAMYYEVAYRGRAFSYTFSPDIFDTKWRRQVALYTNGAETVEAHAAYVAYKYAVLGELMTRPDVFASTGPCDPARLMALVPVKEVKRPRY